MDPVVSALFDQLVVASELSPIFGRGALSRALARLGLLPDRLTKADLMRALPEITRTIRPYLGDRTDEVSMNIQRLIWAADSGVSQSAK